ncbi:trypsin-like serine peptidase [Leptobacterium sp. I13]|uniref:trypsin-like serine peptidase n=1 Tax=Leptobacterium meishanense TaxID=3128904 RepID=UPI0030ED22F7
MKELYLNISNEKGPVYLNEMHNTIDIQDSKDQTDPSNYSGNENMTPLDGEMNTRLKNIFGKDDRRPFENPVYPWGCVGIVDVDSVPGINGTKGTGILVGPRHVLTSNHGVILNKSGGLLPTRFTPAQYKSTKPYGDSKVVTALWWCKVPNGGLTETEKAVDYAILILDKPLGNAKNLGWMGTSVFNETDRNLGWSHIGYPGFQTVPHFQKNIDIIKALPKICRPKYDPKIEVHGVLLGTDADQESGQSGGPLWRFDNGPRIIGVLSGITNDAERFSVFSGGKAMVDLVNFARNKYK